MSVASTSAARTKVSYQVGGNVQLRPRAAPIGKLITNQLDRAH